MWPRILILYLLAGSFNLLAQEDSARWNTSGRLQLSNLGFAPVPAFSFNAPILVGALAVKHKTYAYEPDLAVGLNGKPWMMNNWFRYSFKAGGKSKLMFGINPSLFFSSIPGSPGFISANRNLTTEFVAEHRLKNAVTSLSCMYIHAIDSGTISGTFLDLSVRFRVINAWEAVIIRLKPQLFYFDFEGIIDGLFTSGTLFLSGNYSPVSFYTQGVWPLYTRFKTDSFKWNLGLIVTL